MTFIQYIIAFLVLYLCVYALINRLCRCVEHCATARAYSRLTENGMLAKMEGVDATIRKHSKEGAYVEARADKK